MVTHLVVLDNMKNQVHLFSVQFPTHKSTEGHVDNPNVISICLFVYGLIITEVHLAGHLPSSVLC